MCDRGTYSLEVWLTFVDSCSWLCSCALSGVDSKVMVQLALSTSVQILPPELACLLVCPLFRRPCLKVMAGRMVVMHLSLSHLQAAGGPRLVASLGHFLFFSGLP